MKILGVDPGSLKTGYGLINLEKGRIRAIEYGCISSTSKTPLEKRFVKIYTELNRFIQKTQPDAYAIEALFYCKNPNTALKLGEARGIAILVAAQNNLEIFEYEPRKVKQAVVGFGGAHKSQIKKMVQSILGLDEIKGPEDISDALAVAICHAHYYRV